MMIIDSVKTAKTKSSSINMESDKIATAGLTEKQLQLSVEVWENVVRVVR